MHQKNIIANSHICALLLAACTENDLNFGKTIVNYIRKFKIQCNTILYTAMTSITHTFVIFYIIECLDMYLMCGEPQEAHRIWKEVLTNSDVDIDIALLQVFNSLTQNYNVIII